MNLHVTWIHGTNDFIYSILSTLITINLTELIGLWVIGGGVGDTERSLHFNYSHQLSRKSYKQLSCQTKHCANNSHLILSTPPSKQSHHLIVIVLPLHITRGMTQAQVSALKAVTTALRGHEIWLLGQCLVHDQDTSSRKWFWCDTFVASLYVSLHLVRMISSSAHWVATKICLNRAFGAVPCAWPRHKYQEVV